MSASSGRVNNERFGLGLSTGANSTSVTIPSIIRSPCLIVTAALHVISFCGAAFFLTILTQDI